MTRENRQIADTSWRPCCFTISGVSTGLLVFLLCAQVYAGTASHITVDLVNRSSAPLTGGTVGPTAVVQQASAPVGNGAKVSIVNFAFTPAEITIRSGESVTWSNDDGAPHGLKFNDGAKGTDLLLPAVTFSRRFDRPGTYDYSCAVHPYMTGRVVVKPQ
jgi:plastocyanin